MIFLNHILLKGVYFTSKNELPFLLDNKERHNRSQSTGISQLYVAYWQLGRNNFPAWLFYNIPSLLYFYVYFEILRVALK